MKIKAILLILFCAIGAYSFGQKKEVSGKVTDTNQKPVKGATIFVDQVNTGKQTNKKGVYKVKVDPSVKEISILTADGRTAGQQYTGSTEINFSVPVNFAATGNPVPVTQPEDEQVNIGYGTVNRKNVTTNVSKIDSEKDAFVYKDIYEMLRGKPGVQVSGRSVKIQGGVNSLTSSTEPLFVVDGIIVNSVENVMPQTVKSIEILKGSSAAIYGSRGANGVILITLKK